MTAFARTAAPRSTVVHMVSTGPVRNYSHETACGRRIGDEWAGEYTEQPTGPVTCRQCMPAAVAAEAAEAVRLAETAVFPIGARVGIVTGVQSVSGPWVYTYGTVTGHVEYWHGVTEYVVDVDGEGFLTFREYLLRSTSCVCTDRDGFGHRCAAFPAGAAVGDVLADEVPTGTADEVAAFSRELAAVLSPRSWQEMGHDEARARSMAAHPAGKGRPVKILGEHIVGGLPVLRSTHRDPMTGAMVFVCDPVDVPL